MASGDGIDVIELQKIPPINAATTTSSPATPPATPTPPASPERPTTLVLPTTTLATATVSVNNKKYDDTESQSDVHIIPQLPSSSRQLFHEAAAAHGGDDSMNLLHHELNSAAATQPTRMRSISSTLDAGVSRNPSTIGRHEKKIGHRRVDEGGEVTYKKIQSKQIMGSIQLGIQYSVGSLASKPKRDLLMNDFWEMESIDFPPEGSSITPAHHYNDFRFKIFAPIAFRYFRDLFGIAPDDFLMSMCASPLFELSNPGASGSLFYLTNDDEFIIKTVQKKECEFLQKLLPGYYMNLSQNPRTLLPKFFGLYCFHYNSKNVRLLAMNNLIPSDIKIHAKFDLKGSTFRRKASKTERQKASPTYKDLDFMEQFPNGIFLETDKYNALMNTIKRDCMVLESFQIMDYSLLVGIHNLDKAQQEKRDERIRNARAKLQRSEEIRETDDTPEADQAQVSIFHAGAAATPRPSNALQVAAAGSAGLNRSRSMNRQRLVAHSTAMESITADLDAPFEEDEDVPAGGIPARSENDERLILYLGIIDILQSYRLEKKLEHTFKSIIYNGDTVSVCRPSFYAQRFQNFMGKTVFKKTPTFPLKHSPSKRKTSNVAMRTPQRMPSQGMIRAPVVMTGSSTPPPAFDDISEEDITATSSTAGLKHQSINSRTFTPQRSYVSSNRSALSSATDDYSDDDAASASGLSHTSRFTATRSPRLTKTNVQVTTIGHVQPTAVDATENDVDAIVLKKPNENNTIVNMYSNDEDAIEEIDANGKPTLTTTKTTVIEAVRAQTYTTTLVVNDVVR